MLHNTFQIKRNIRGGTVVMYTPGMIDNSPQMVADRGLGIVHFMRLEHPIYNRWVM